MLLVNTPTNSTQVDTTSPVSGSQHNLELSRIEPAESVHMTVQNVLSPHTTNFFPASPSLGQAASELAAVGPSGVFLAAGLQQDDCTTLQSEDMVLTSVRSDTRSVAESRLYYCQCGKECTR